MGGSLLSWTHAYLYLHSLYTHAVWSDGHSTDTIFISLRTKCVHGKFCKVLKSQDLNKSNLEKPLGGLAVEGFFFLFHIPSGCHVIFSSTVGFFQRSFGIKVFQVHFFCIRYSNVYLFHHCISHVSLRRKLAPWSQAHRKTQASRNTANWARRDALRLATRSILREGG